MTGRGLRGMVAPPNGDTGIIVFNGHAGAGPILIDTVKAGDVVKSLRDVSGTPFPDARLSFEKIISEDGKLKQISTLDLSAKEFFGLVVAKG